jgi:hypothetical protein
MENDWAMVIGINNYPKLSGVKPLQGAADDAGKFHKWLVDPLGGAVPDAHIGKFIQETNRETNPALQNRPIGPELMTFIEQNLLALLPAKPIGRRFYLYFSGHGISPTGQESIRNAALLMANAILPKPLLHISGNILAEGMRSSAYFREVVLIMDCCRDLENNVIPNGFDIFDPNDAGRNCLLFEAYATTWGSKARELALPPDGKVQGVFTHSLLEVLKSGRMTGRMLKMSVTQHLTRLLKDERKSQDPVIGQDMDLPKIIFNEAAPAPRTPVTIQGHPDHTLPDIEFFPEGSDTSEKVVMDDWTFHDGSWQGWLEPSTYELRIPGGGARRLRIFAGVPEEVNL